MRIERVQAKQGHPVPRHGHMPRGPFPPELLAPPEIITDYEPQADGGGPQVPEGGTAQNGFRAFKWFRCKECEWVLREDEVKSHDCSDWPYEDEEDEDDDDEY